MKNEKICFSKGVGLIALVGVVLITLALLMGSVPSKTTSTNTKAFFGCPDNSFPKDKCASGHVAKNAFGRTIYEDGKICCFFGAVYTTHCPEGSTPDPWTLCETKGYGKIVYNGRGTTPNNRVMAKKTDGTPVQCCNWYGTVQNNAVSSKELPKIDPAVQEEINTEAPYVLQDKKYCSDLGLFQVPTVLNDKGYDVPKMFVNDYYKKYCNQNENKPQWNGAYGDGTKWGEKAKCYTATGICAVAENCNDIDCLRGQSAAERCLNIEVDFKKCVDAKVHPNIAKADPKTPDNERCTGTCYGGIEIGKCAPGYARRCECTYADTGLLFPKYMDNIACAPKAKTCLDQAQEWRKQGVKACDGFAKYNECTKDKYRCGCDAAGKYTYPTLQKDVDGCTIVPVTM